jgi:aminomethyltransferase
MMADINKTALQNDTAPALLMRKALENHRWRQSECVNLIPSEQSHSRAVRLLSILDPSFRYAEHKRI